MQEGELADPGHGTCCLLCRHVAGAAVQLAASERAPRFFVQQRLPPSPGTPVQLPQEESKHALRVLRLRESDRVELCDGLGNIVPAQIQSAALGLATVLTTDAPQQVCSVALST